MASNIFGIHDPGGEWIIKRAGRSGYVVFTEAIGCNPNDLSGKDFDLGAPITSIVRLNNGYGTEGTIPLPAQYAAFAHRCANFVNGSHGANIWIIGNEINMRQEHPSDQEIHLEDYVSCFTLCRLAIKSVQPNAVVIPQPFAPWNATMGDWVDATSTMLNLIGPGNCDGIALHAYSHRHTPAQIVDEARMDPPFEDRHYQFRVYRDLMNAIPAPFRSLPVYITESNVGEPWRDENNGWVQAAYKEINEWNQQPDVQQIHALCLYRWPRYDQWSFSDKQGVIDDFSDAMKNDYRIEQRVPARFKAGNTVQTTTTARLRFRPGIVGKPPEDTLTLLPTGTFVTLCGLPVLVDGLVWWYIGTGWIAESLLDMGVEKDIAIARLCTRYGIDEQVIRAVLEIESGASGFRGGRLLIRFEPHIFLQRITTEQRQVFYGHFQIGAPIWDGNQHRFAPAGDGNYIAFHGNQDLEWQALTLAIEINEDAAYNSASYGLPQMMGFNHAACGYPTAREMVEAFKTGEGVQIEAMFRFIQDNGGIVDLRNRNFVAFAAKYNGTGQAAAYAALIEGKL
jgi:hypothetical protein